VIDLNAVWFLLVGVLIAGYAILDGFDLGVGMLHLFARTDTQRRIHMNAIGPVWDGNEVWLLTAGGALFAAFPMVYATAFSSFYLAIMLLLVALIFRAVSLEFRGKVDSPKWKRVWDWSFGLGSWVATFLYGVAVGNVMRGIPLDQNGVFTGTFLGLLNPYALLVGALSVTMFLMHGAVYMTLKTDGDLQARMKKWAVRSWVVLVPLYFLTIGFSIFVAGFLFDGLLTNWVFWLFLLVWQIAVLLVPVFTQLNRFRLAFLSSAITIASMIGLAAVSLFPKLLPSSTDLAYSLTAYNASSTPRTLTAMLYIALIGMPLVIAYTAFIYRIFKGKVVLTEESY